MANSGAANGTIDGGLGGATRARAPGSRWPLLLFASPKSAGEPVLESRPGLAEETKMITRR
jgi:hypothetical protein